MSTIVNQLGLRWELDSPLNAKIVEACQYIDKAAKASHRDYPLGIDYVRVDIELAHAIAILASARAIAITEGNLSDPAFDDGDVWDWDDEVGLPGAIQAREANGGDA